MRQDRKCTCPKLQPGCYATANISGLANWSQRTDSLWRRARAAPSRAAPRPPPPRPTPSAPVIAHLFTTYSCFFVFSTPPLNSPNLPIICASRSHHVGAAVIIRAKRLRRSAAHFRRRAERSAANKGACRTRAPVEICFAELIGFYWAIQHSIIHRSSTRDLISAFGMSHQRNAENK